MDAAPQRHQLDVTPQIASRGWLGRLQVGLVVFAALLATWPVTASGSTVSIDIDGTLTYMAEAGEVNELVVSKVAGEYDLVDPGAVIVTPPCTSVDVAGHHVTCPGADVRIVHIELGDLDDQLTIADSAYPPFPPPDQLYPVFGDGGPGVDTLSGAAGADELYGGSGGDFVTGGGGADLILGSTSGLIGDEGVDGTDVVDGGSGNDELVRGGPGVDEVFGGDGDDVVAGDTGDDTVVDGGGGNDDVVGGQGDDHVRGGAGEDRVDVGGDPNSEDVLGRDTLEGGSDDDVLGVGPSGILEADVLSGGDGDDRVSYNGRRAPLSVALDAVANDGEAGEADNVLPDVERVTGSTESDSLIGSDGSETLDGGPGDDLVRGLGGNDTLQGGVNDGGSDSLLGDAGADELTGGPGDDSLDGGIGDDPLFGGGGSDTLVGGIGQDTLAGGPGLDSVQGGDGDDTLNGGAVPLVGADGADDLLGGDGDDVLLGGPGNDREDGGLGADRIRGEEGRDTVSYEDRGARISVTFDGEANDGEPGEGDNVFADIEIVLAGAVADTLSGDARANVLDAGSGDDYLIGGGGQDKLAGGTDIDVLHARDRTADLLSCGPGIDLAIADRIDTLRDCDYVNRGGRRPPPLGRAALALPTSGTVSLRLPSASRSVPLRDALEVPLRSTLDARKGTVRVVTRKRRGGRTQEASVRGGAFTVHQRRVARPVTELRLRGGDFTSCGPARGRTSVRARLGVRIARRPGRYRVRGRYSIGGSYGTSWWTEERCNGTRTHVATGTVRVRDFGRDRWVVVNAGQSHLARPR